MENNFTKEVGYSLDKNDFILEQELTVTITLHEYRELVDYNARAKGKIEEIQSGKQSRE